jgi:hypothetical protein
MFSPTLTYSVYALCEHNPETSYHESCGYENYAAAQKEVERLSQLGYLVKLYCNNPILLETVQPQEEEDDEFEEKDNYEQQEWEDLYPPNDY